MYHPCLHKTRIGVQIRKVLTIRVTNVCRGFDPQREERSNSYTVYPLYSVCGSIRVYASCTQRGARSRTAGESGGWVGEGESFACIFGERYEDDFEAISGIRVAFGARAASGERARRTRASVHAREREPRGNAAAADAPRRG